MPGVGEPLLGLTLDRANDKGKKKGGILFDVEQHEKQEGVRTDEYIVEPVNTEVHERIHLDLLISQPELDPKDLDEATVEGRVRAFIPS